MEDFPLGRYRHYKGREYRVMGVATHSETGERLVVYQCLYDDFSLWARPMAMFTEQVKVDGKWQARFAFISADLGAGEVDNGEINTGELRR